MNESYIQTISIVVVTVGLAIIGFLYWSEPKSFAEVATKTQVAIGTYAVDRAEFESGLASFRRDEFVAARAAFERADPEMRDAATQFYVAYSFYRQGWGRFSNDDALFRSGVTAVNRVIAIGPSFRTSDETLQLKTPIELKLELEEGLKITMSDFNPLRVVRERK